MGAELAEVESLCGEHGEDRGTAVWSSRTESWWTPACDAVRLDSVDCGEECGIDCGCVVAAGGGELDDVLAADGGDESRRSAEGDDAAVVHDGDAVAEALGLVHVVGGEDDGAACLLELVE